MPRLAHARRNALLITVLLLSACGDGFGGGTEPRTGTVSVTISTTGRVLDRDGYTLTLQGGTDTTQAPANGSVETRQLPEGTHTLRLGGIAQNCDVQGDSVRTVTVSARTEARAEFQVTCDANLIAYSGSPPEWRLTVGRVDGTRRVQVATRVSSRSDWSPDGQHLVYAVQSTTHINGYDLWRFDVGSGTSIHIQPAGIEYAIHPTWSPDGSRIAFTGSPANGGPGLYTMRADGSELRAITPPADFHRSFPVWSPDGTRIAYRYSEFFTQQIWISAADGSGGRPVVDVESGYEHFDWSPDGTRILFAVGRGWHKDLYTIGVDGTGETRLTNTPDVSETYPTYLPDGRIGFTAAGDVWVMNADGTAPVKVTQSTEWEYVPSWQ